LGEELLLGPREEAVPLAPALALVEHRAGNLAGHRGQELGAVVDDRKPDVEVVEELMRARVEAVVADDLPERHRRAAELRLVPSGEQEVLPVGDLLADGALGPEDAAIALPALAEV